MNANTATTINTANDPTRKMDTAIGWCGSRRSHGCPNQLHGPNGTNTFHSFRESVL